MALCPLVLILFSATVCIGFGFQGSGLTLVTSGSFFSCCRVIVLLQSETICTPLSGAGGDLGSNQATVTVDLFRGWPDLAHELQRANVLTYTDARSEQFFPGA